MVTLAAAPKPIVTATRRISTYCMAEPNAGALMRVPNGARALRLWQGVRSPGQARRSGRERPCPPRNCSISSPVHRHRTARHQDSTPPFGRLKRLALI
jgi:hypothetical protein